ncbi:MAG TPA: DUF4918 domain-containing protein, partial [Daejeonella sp.]|nr:DUF4918 domain-containing protein [Daejeonella sp.]
GVNMNYYDQKKWAETLKPLMADWLKTQLSFGGDAARCVCLGSGKNLTYLKQLNHQNGFFKRIDVLDHPRFIMQYRRKKLTEYLEQYVEVLNFNL